MIYFLNTYNKSRHTFSHLLSALLLVTITLSGCKYSSDTVTSSGQADTASEADMTKAGTEVSNNDTYEEADNTTILNNGEPFDGSVILNDNFDGSDYIRMSELVEGSSVSNSINIYPTLSVPTDITFIDGNYYIVDCYHSQIIYNDDLTSPLTDWSVLTDNASSGYSLGHTIVSDGSVMLADDTENNRVLVFEKRSDGYTLTQIFNEIGNKPHYIVYNKDTDAFYCWSSYSGEMYIFRHKENDTRMYLTNVITIQRLSDTYVRSFTINDGDLYFVSGLPADGSSNYASQILKYDLYSFSRKESYNVPDNIAGMVQLEHIGDMFYITVSTDIYGNQDAATMICAPSIEDISSGNYETVYDKYFVGGGTPYYMGLINDTWYLTEHRLTDHAIWSFDTDTSGHITSSTAIY